ncbi:cytochrome P450 [Artemisia annua]|uniref:Cytochrome P450 n=1 Tax=Artemisia annua TaxID=35608 RepID=A0A2U1P8N3_ARTAN|nr:cytochrome P450 [Artemisia annua]
MFLSFQLLLFSITALFILLLLWIPIRWLTCVSQTQKNLPPSPRKLPIIGNLHQLGSNLHHHSFKALSHKHGPLILIHLGSSPVLVVSSAEAAREIMKTHDSIFSSRHKLSIPDKLNYGSKNIGFAPYGEHWRQVRRIAEIHLLSNKRVQSFRQIREREMIRMIDMIDKSGGFVVDLTEMLVSLDNRYIGSNLQVSRIINNETSIMYEPSSRII